MPPQGGGQATQEPNSVKAPAVEAECEENPAQGKWQEAQRAENQDNRKQTQPKAHMSLSQIPEDLPLRWEALAPMAGMPNKISLPLQSLISCFIESTVQRWVQWVQLRGAGRGYSLVGPKVSTICWAPVAVTQAGGGFFCP